EVERLVAQLLRVHEQPAHNRNVATVAQRELVLYGACKLGHEPLDHTRSTLLSFRARGVLAAPLREAVAQLRPLLGELSALDPGIVGDDPTDVFGARTHGVTGRDQVCASSAAPWRCRVWQ